MYMYIKWFFVGTIVWCYSFLYPASSHTSPSRLKSTCLVPANPTLESEISPLAGLHGHLPADFDKIAQRIQQHDKVSCINDRLIERIGWNSKEFATLSDPLYKLNTTVAAAIACTRDGKKVFIGTSNGLVRMLDTEQGFMELLGRHDNGVLALACTHDGADVFSVGRDGMVFMWKVKERTCDTIGSGAYQSIACASDGSRVFLAPEGYSGRMIELLTHVLQPVYAFSSMTTKLACDAEGQRVFAGTVTGRSVLWDYDAQKTKRICWGPHKEPIIAAACSEDGKTFFSATSDRDFQVWSAVSPGHVRRGRCPNEIVSALTCSSDGKRLFVGTELGTIHEWRMQDDGRITKFNDVYDIASVPRLITDGTSRIVDIVCSHDGSLVFTVSPRAMTIWSDYQADLTMMDPDLFALLSEVAVVWKEKNRPCIVDFLDSRWTDLLIKYPYLEHKKLCVMPIEDVVELSESTTPSNS